MAVIEGQARVAPATRPATAGFLSHRTQL